jgi:hypothetical protein
VISATFLSSLPFLKRDLNERQKEMIKRKSPKRKGMSPGPGLWKLPRLYSLEKNIIKRLSTIQKTKKILSFFFTLASWILSSYQTFTSLKPSIVPC